MFRFRLATKIFLMGLIVTACFSASYAWLYPRFKAALYASKNAQTQFLVETAASAVDHYVKAAAGGSLTVEEARRQAMAAVRSMRYGDNDYFWINDLAPAMVMHPMKPELDGKDLSQNKDPNGKPLFMEMVKVCREKGGGFVDYFWPKPGAAQPVPKVSFVKQVPQWGWVIGTGVYVDDVEAETRRLLWGILLVVAGVTAGGLVLAFVTARSIARPVNRIIAELDEGAGQVSSAVG